MLILAGSIRCSVEAHASGSILRPQLRSEGIMFLLRVGFQEFDVKPRPFASALLKHKPFLAELICILHQRCETGLLVLGQHS